MPRTTVPPPPSADAYAAAAAIYDRRRRAGDRDLERFPDASDLAGLWAVRVYVGTCQSVPPSVLADDALDLIVIIRYLSHTLDVAQCNVINAARRWGVAYSVLAGPLGLRSRQGAEQAHARLLQHLRAEGGRRSEVDYRRDRYTTTGASWSTATTDPAETIPDVLVAALQRLVAAQPHMPADLADDVEELKMMTDPRVAVAWGRVIVREAQARTDLPADVAAAVRAAAAALTA